MTSKAILVDSLSLSIDGARILREVSMQVCAGEVCSIIGPNGAGKSTLLKCLMRIRSGWTGRVALHGRDLASLSQRELARRIAYVPQHGDNAASQYTVRDFVRMGRYTWSGPFGTAHPDDSRAIESALLRAGVHAFSDRTLNTLSGGERQKVHIAAALAQGADTLLLDEPTAFLDYRHQTEVAEIIRRLNRGSGATIVSVTHDVNAAMCMGGSVVALRDGEMVWSGKAGELACERTLNRIFGAVFRFLKDPVTGLRLIAPQGAEISA